MEGYIGCKHGDANGKDHGQSKGNWGYIGVSGLGFKVWGD